MPSIDFKLDFVDPNKLADDVRVPTMRKVTNIVKKYARRAAPRGKGDAKTSSGKPRVRLYKSIGSTVRDKGRTAAVFAKAYHSSMVHEGTKRHRIKARGSKALVIGGHIIGKAVNHPGAKANPFLERGAEMARGEVEAALKDVI